MTRCQAAVLLGLFASVPTSQSAGRALGALSWDESWDSLTIGRPCLEAIHCASS